MDMKASVTHTPAKAKTVLITGCSSGLGKATAVCFARNGWNVLATMRRPEAEQELTKLNNVLVTGLDVQDPDGIRDAVATGIRHFGRIDALVNNAGFGLFGIFEATSRERIEEQFSVNLFGAMNVIRELLPHFRANRKGIILNVSSGAGVFGLPMISLYCASKFVLEGFSEALSYELTSQNIIVKIVEPGGMVKTNFGKRSAQESALTDRIPDYDEFVTQASSFFERLRARRIGTEEKVAEVILNAATDGTAQLRYVATEDIKPWVEARRQTSEEQYMEYMRQQFTSSIPAEETVK
jgi:NAD(P)-dependent dehydrogenase (short-subunit alcohol dehydrogenase family)